VNRDREITKKYVQHAEKRGVKALFITVDAPQLGRREKDMRMKFVDDGAGAKVQEGQSDVKKDQGVARAISVRINVFSGFGWSRLTPVNTSPLLTLVSPGKISLGSEVSPSVSRVIHFLAYLFIGTLRSSVHIILKGVATPEDAILAYESGCQGIVLSNHGGRQLDTSRSGLENLIDIVAALKTKGPWPNPNFAVFVDGGVRRASDVLKAIALGASAVGVGRGFLYAFSSYGQEGVERAIEILRVSKLARARVLVC
jgi:L-lactate dehydrogenase (cytochrome)